jgi:hypothetical protein
MQNLRWLLGWGELKNIPVIWILTPTYIYILWQILKVLYIHEKGHTPKNCFIKELGLLSEGMISKLQFTSLDHDERYLLKREGFLVEVAMQSFLFYFICVGVIEGYNGVSAWKMITCLYQVWCMMLKEISHIGNYGKSFSDCKQMFLGTTW